MARANLFLAHRYKLRLSDLQRQLFEAWNVMLVDGLFSENIAMDILITLYVIDFSISLYRGYLAVVGFRHKGIKFFYLSLASLGIFI
ncbi:hypothetical protein [Legionella jordanis]|uniref:hypothetical protein n=1 Tax=Legionella jordanis TaxID=456 RepID=UPI000EFF9119|nr:hypothetical protein [Legionella jordanis]